MLAQLERIVGAVVSAIGVGISVFLTFYAVYFVMPKMGTEHGTIEEALAPWIPQIIIIAMLMVLGLALVGLGNLFMKRAAPIGVGVTERRERPPEVAPPPVPTPTLPRPLPEVARPSMPPEERPVRMAFEAALREEVPPPTPKPERPVVGPPAEERGPPEPGPAEERGPPEVRPALDEDELSRIIRILRERRKRA